MVGDNGFDVCEYPNPSENLNKQRFINFRRIRQHLFLYKIEADK